VTSKPSQCYLEMNTNQRESDNACFGAPREIYWRRSFPQVPKCSSSEDLGGLCRLKSSLAFPSVVELPKVICWFFFLQTLVHLFRSLLLKGSENTRWVLRPARSFFHWPLVGSRLCEELEGWEGRVQGASGRGGRKKKVNRFFKYQGGGEP